MRRGRWAQFSIRHKLRLIVLVAAGVALTGACLLFVLFDVARQRNAMLEDYRTLAELVGSNSVSALAFSDERLGEEILAGLRAQHGVLEAAIYDSEGRPIAGYVRTGRVAKELPPLPPPDGTRFETYSLVAVRAVELDGDRVGTVYIRADLERMSEVLYQELGITAFVLLVSSLAAVLLGDLLQRPILGSITNLVNTAREFSVRGGADVRATKFSEDELGLLVDSFNEMLARIESDMELQKHNEELLREKDRVEASSRSKSEFLANMSHEIRTPMTAILGYIDLLSEPGLSQEERESHNETIRRNGQHLLNIINDILDLSKIEAGKLVVERVRCEMRELIDDLVVLMGQRAAERGLAFDLVYQGPVPRTIETDPTRLRQILTNLLGNAVKFTSDGFVRLSIGLANDDADAALVRFSVSDSGIGMSPEQMLNIFDPFAQADSSTTRRFGGTGLGLAISKRLAERLGGGIAIESHENRGSTFTLTIDAGSLEGVPLDVEPVSAPGRELTEEAEPVAERHSGRVLVAEDGPDNQRLIRAFLKADGFDVDVVDTGSLALDAALAALESGEPYDVILMDMNMPVMDGYEATRRLRAEGYRRPIVALTARAMKGERDECLQAGCDDYASKPIDRAALLQLVAEYAEKARRSA